MIKNFIKNLLGINQAKDQNGKPDPAPELEAETETADPLPVERKFMSDEQEWIASHYIDCINQTREFTGFDFTQAAMLDVGCGDCLISYGFLNLPIKKLVGLDIVPEEKKNLGGLPGRIAGAGFEPPAELDRFQHVHYDGGNFPFKEETFDFIFSWSAFEHIKNVDQVLREIYRVLKQDGLCYIQVYPWYPSFHGSHLTDYIKEDFFHLKKEKAEIRQWLNDIAEKAPEKKDFLINHLWPEFLSLNGFSADMFYRAVQKAGFKVAKARLISFDQDLRQAPANYSLSELMISGTMMLLEK